MQRVAISPLPSIVNPPARTEEAVEAAGRAMGMGRALRLLCVVEPNTLVCAPSVGHDFLVPGSAGPFRVTPERRGHGSHGRTLAPRGPGSSQHNAARRRAGLAAVAAAAPLPVARGWQGGTATNPHSDEIEVRYLLIANYYF